MKLLLLFFLSTTFVINLHLAEHSEIVVVGFHPWYGNLYTTITCAQIESSRIALLLPDGHDVPPFV